MVLVKLDGKPILIIHDKNNEDKRIGITFPNGFDDLEQRIEVIWDG